jgi:PHD/YefM family antitoxin component YafN of YafNO toxin-antitoxin module
MQRKSRKTGKKYILRNNQPDAVLFAVNEYERLSVFIEYLESLEENAIAAFLESLPKEGKRKRYLFDQLKADIHQLD